MRANFHRASRHWRLYQTMLGLGMENYETLQRSSVVPECPACPRPGINLPENWKLSPHKYETSVDVCMYSQLLSRDLLYAKFLMGDGNFHLQLRLLSKGLDRDPSFFGDSGFWANETLAREYRKHAETMVNVDTKVGSAGLTDYMLMLHQDPACTGQAGTAQRDRPSSKYSVSCIFSTQCKHGLFLPNGTVDFQKGER